MRLQPSFISRLSPLGRVGVVALGVVIVALVIAVPSVGYAAYNAATSPLFPKGTTIGGVDVSGMSEHEARAAVRSKVSERLDRKATVRVGKREYTVTPRELGADAQVRKAVQAAERRAQQTSWWARLTGTANGPDVDVAVSEAAEKQVNRVVRKMVKRAHVAPENATLALVGGTPEVTPASPGWRVKPKVARKALATALERGDTRTVERRKIKPDVTAAAYDTVIVINDGTNTLRFYEDGQLSKTYGVALGMPGHRTPHGRFEVTLKRPSPTWVNPAPNGWGKDMPKRIGPGPNNPLGLRALNLSSPGIRIHGTSAVSSIGQDASHGCIRLTNSNILELFPQVPAGATVFITS